MEDDSFQGKNTLSESKQLKTQSIKSLQELSMKVVVDNFQYYPESFLKNIPEPCSSRIKEDIDHRYNFYTHFFEKRFNFFAEPEQKSSSIITFNKKNDYEIITSNPDLSLFCRAIPGSKEIFILKKEGSGNELVGTKKIVLPEPVRFIPPISYRNHLACIAGYQNNHITIYDLESDTQEPLFTTNKIAFARFSPTGNLIAIVKSMPVPQTYLPRATVNFIYKVVINRFNSNQKQYNSLFKFNWTQHKITSIVWGNKDDLLAIATECGDIIIYTIANSQKLVYQAYNFCNGNIQLHAIGLSLDFTYLAISHTYKHSGYSPITIIDTKSETPPIDICHDTGPAENLSFDPTSKLLFINCKNNNTFLIFRIDNLSNTFYIYNLSNTFYTESNKKISISNPLYPNKLIITCSRSNRESRNSQALFVSEIKNFNELPLSVFCALFTITKHPENATLETLRILQKNGFELGRLKITPKEMETINNNSLLLNEQSIQGSVFATSIFLSKIKWSKTNADDQKTNLKKSESYDDDNLD